MRDFSRVSGYRVNDQNLLSGGFLFHFKSKANISAFSVAHWAEQGVKYLGITLSRDLGKLADLNLTPLLNVAAIFFARWKIYTLSWFDQMADNKMIILN